MDRGPTGGMSAGARQGLMDTSSLAEAPTSKRGHRASRRPPASGNEAERDTGFVPDGFILDFISDTKTLKATPREIVRQRIARALVDEYGISVDDMEADFRVVAGGRRRRVDLAVFAAGEPHDPEHL